MTGTMRFAAVSTLALATGAPQIAGAMPGWMTEQAMRAAFIGQTLDGHYVDGLRWTESYNQDGRLEYGETGRFGRGYWYFRGNVFCTFYDPGYGLGGGCWNAVKASANCYEFHAAGLADGEHAGPGPLDGWAARAWRRDEPSTCEQKPSA